MDLDISTLLVVFWQRERYISLIASFFENMIMTIKITSRVF